MAKAINKAGGVFGKDPDVSKAALERGGIFNYKISPNIMPEKITTGIPKQYVRNQGIEDLMDLGDAASMAADQTATAAAQAAAAATIRRSTGFPWTLAAVVAAGVLAVGWMIKDH
jgi:hypothetical protein